MPSIGGFLADDSLQRKPTLIWLIVIFVLSDYPLYLASFHDFLVNCCAFTLEFCTYWR